MVLRSLFAPLLNRTGSSKAPSAGPRANAFHCVSVAVGAGACEAARTLAGRRFLSKDAPSLPLPGCAIGDCACVYRHHGDRRISNRRRGVVSGAGVGVGADRRRSVARRATDG